LGSVGVTAAAPANGPEWGVRPALTGETTLESNHFAYALPAGAQVSDAIVVFNFSDAPLTFHVHGADLVSVAGGSVAPAPEGTTAHLVGTWISVSQQELTVPAHQELSDQFTVSVPAGTGPGDHLGAVVVAKQAAAPQSIQVLTRAALIVKATVPGQVHLGVILGPLSAAQLGSDERFSIDVHNAGNVLFTFTGEVTVRNGSGIVATVPVDPQGIYVIPGGSATVHATWHGVPALGEVSAVASVHIKVNQLPSGTFTSNTLLLSFFPWGMLVIVVVALLAILLTLLATLIVRRRRDACSHCRTRYRRQRLAEVTEKAEVAMCRRCLGTVRQAGRALLCTSCLQQHLLQAGRAAHARRRDRPDGGSSVSGARSTRAQPEPPKQRKTAAKAAGARAQAEPPEQRKTAAKSAEARGQAEPPKHRKTAVKAATARSLSRKARS
jgi:hypothetical protein